MKCEHCNTPNAENRTFCRQCGNLLGWVCQCSFVNQPGDLYCGGCGKATNDEKQKQAQKSIRIGQAQFTSRQIQQLLKESLDLKFKFHEKISQNDIDKVFESS